VIVGTGVAGTSTAASLRQHGYDGRLVLVGDEPHPPYRRTALSKDVLAGTKRVDEVGLTPGAWWADNAVELLTGTTVTAVRPGAVELDGRSLLADAVVLATGGRARPLALLPQALTIRTAADVDALLPRLRGRVVVVGAGFLGLEVATAALAHGCDVTVLEAAPLPLARALPEVVASALVARYLAAGVDLRCGVDPSSLPALTPGADVVVAAVGQDPAVELAAAAGAGLQNGVVVDRFGRSWLPGLWAAGDVAAFPHRLFGTPHRHEHWTAAMNQGAAVGQALLGLGDGWRDVPWAWSQHLGLDLQVCGELGDEVRIEGDLSGSFCALLSRGERLTGAVTVDRTPAMRDLRRLVAEEAHLDEVDATSR
jgi:NADPH-dependent 2,4-dienoyl-CoA reductase/sulfur reductase-like enzyme